MATNKQVDMSYLDSNSACGLRSHLPWLAKQRWFLPEPLVGKRVEKAGLLRRDGGSGRQGQCSIHRAFEPRSSILVTTGQSGEVKRATCKDARNRIDMLKELERRREDEEKMGEADITGHQKNAEDVEAAERTRKRRRKREENAAERGEGCQRREGEWEGRTPELLPTSACIASLQDI